MTLLSQITDPKKFAIGFVFFLVGLTMLRDFLPDIIAIIVNFSTISNLGFSSFFSANGVVLLLVGVGVLITIIGLLGIGKGGKE